MKVYFWQIIISPHMASLAVELAKLGVEVCYVANVEMTADRVALGWSAPKMPDVQLYLVKDHIEAKVIAKNSESNSIHICQGIRGNGYVSQIQREFLNLNRKFLVVMETVDDRGLQGVLKRLVYRYLFKRFENNIEMILASGKRLPKWILERGVKSEKIFPFAYFLSEQLSMKSSKFFRQSSKVYNFIFVGQFIKRKNLDLLIESLEKISFDYDFSLTLVGSGELEPQLRSKVSNVLGDRIIWKGKLSMGDVKHEICKADCLVLPSYHDGWGAVVSESLQVGTPVICSDGCGSSVIVESSGFGRVFQNNSINSLTDALVEQINQGKISSSLRKEISDWAECLGAKAGARYLLDILEFEKDNKFRPIEPWNRFNELYAVFQTKH